MTLAQKSRRGRNDRLVWAALWWGWAWWAVVFWGTAWSLAEWTPVSQTPLLEDRTGAYLAEVSRDRDLGFWEIGAVVPPRMAEAVIAAEDVRFRWFWGVDPIAILRSGAALVTGGRTQGGSTIAMQVARLQSDHRRTVSNKLLEMATGFLLTAKFGHDRVLRRYLTLLPQGARMFGVAYSARRYFQKPVEDLSWAEACLLAAVPQAPGQMNLFSSEGFRRAQDRAARILEILRRTHRLTEADAAAAAHDLAALRAPRAPARPQETYHWVLRALEEDAKDPVGVLTGPRRTTLDPQIQAAAQETVRRLYEQHAEAGVGNAAAMVVDRASGAVLAYVGSYGYFSPLGSGAIDYLRVPRSSGSTLKPLLYAIALDERTASPASVLADLPFSLLDPKGVYRPGNFDDEFLGPMLFRRALANSRNIPVLRILEGIGLPRAYSRLASLGLVHDDRGADWYGYGLALGGLYVSLEDLVKAYGLLATDGREFRLRFFLDQPPSEGRTLLSPYATRTVSLALSDETARQPSFPRGGPMDYEWPVAVKTGTSQGYRDAWAIAYDHRFVAGVWLGDADAEPMNRIAGQVAAQGLRQLLTSLEPLQAQGVDAVPFPPPDQAEFCSVCVLSGQRAGPDCQSVSWEPFLADAVPREVCQVHVRRPVDVRTGGVPTRLTPPDRIVLRPFTVLGPEYAVWARHRGLPVPPGEAAGPRRFQLLAPLSGSTVFRDPETPPAFQTLSLQVLASPAPPEVEWYVDGTLFRTVTYPYSVRWPLVPGTHRFQARWPGTTEVSSVAQVEVR